jgi:hypothetical protein
MPNMAVIVGSYAAGIDANSPLSQGNEFLFFSSQGIIDVDGHI